MTEMSKLIEMLTMAGIPFEVQSCYDGVQVCYPNATNIVCDAIYHRGSYGYDEGLLEIMGLVDTEDVGDNVEGYLTATDVATRIISHYKNQQRRPIKATVRLTIKKRKD